MIMSAQGPGNSIYNVGGELVSVIYVQVALFECYQKLIFFEARQPYCFKCIQINLMCSLQKVGPITGWNGRQHFKSV